MPKSLPFATLCLSAMLLVGQPLHSAAPTATATPTLSGGGLLRPFVVGGQVMAIERDGDQAILGGTFSYVGGHTGAAALLVTATGAADLAFPPINGTVHAIEPDGSGGWYVGGDFLSVAGVPSANLIHVHDNGSVDPAFTPDPQGPVYHLAAVPGGGVYAQGNFPGIEGGGEVNYIAKIGPGGLVDWSFLVPIINPAQVQTMRADASGLYLGGTFTTVGGNGNYAYLVRLNPTTGGVDASFTPYPNALVRDIALGASDVYVSGDFTALSGVAKSYVAKVAKSGAAADAGFTAGLPFDQGAHALALVGGDLYVSGDDSGGGQRLAKLNASTGAADGGFACTANATVRRLVHDGSATLYAQGEFADLGGAPRSTVGAVDAATGVTTGFSTAIYAGTANAIAFSAPHLYIGGAFHSAGGINTYGLARVHLDTAQVDRSFPATNGQVNELKVYGSNLYVGGTFTTIGGQSRPYLARVALGTGTVDPSFAPAPNNRIDALDVDSSGNPYVAGIFDTIGGQSRQGPAKLSPADGSLLGEFPAVSAFSIEDLALDNTGYLYMAGHFTSVAGFALSRAAKVAVATGVPDTAFNPAANDNPYQIQPDNLGNVYLAGRFTTLGGVSKVRIAKLSAATGLPDGSFSASSTGAVNAIYLDGNGRVVIGGEGSGKIRRLDPSSGGLDSIDLFPANNIGALAPGRTSEEVLVGFSNTSVQSWGASRVAGFGLFKMAPPVVPTATPTESATATWTQSATPSPSPSATPTPSPSNTPVACVPVGESSVLGLSQSWMTNGYAFRYTLSDVSTFDEMRVHFSNGTGLAQFAVYADDGSGTTPGALAGQGSVTNPAMGWVTVALSPNPVLTPGTVWLVVSTDATLEVSTASTGGPGCINSLFPMGGSPFPSTFPCCASTQANYRISFYGVACPATLPSPTPTATPNLDLDGDGVPNATDNCPNQANSGQEDQDGDGWGDVCDFCAVDDPTRHPGAVEVYNGIDDNCDGNVDEGLTPTHTPTPSRTPAQSATATASPSATVSHSATSSASPTVSSTFTATRTPTSVYSPTVTRTSTVTRTPSTSIQPAKGPAFVVPNGMSAASAQVVAAKFNDPKLAGVVVASKTSTVVQMVLRQPASVGTLFLYDSRNRIVGRLQLGGIRQVIAFDTKGMAPGTYRLVAPGPLRLQDGTIMRLDIRFTVNRSTKR